MTLAKGLLERGELPWAALLISATCAVLPSPSIAPAQQTGKERAAIVIQSFEAGLTAVRAANAGVKLSIVHDDAMPSGAALVVEYPLPTQNPGGRDVWCEAEAKDWTAG